MVAPELPSVSSFFTQVGTLVPLLGYSLWLLSMLSSVVLMRLLMLSQQEQLV